MRTNKKVFLLTIGIVSIGWLIVMCAIDKLNPSGISGSIGLLFGMLGFVLVLIFIVLTCTVVLTIIHLHCKIVCI